MTYPAVITKLNTILSTLNIKDNPTDAKPIQIRSVHRHPSNNLVLYTTTPQQADTLHQQGEKWLPALSTNLSL